MRHPLLENATARVHKAGCQEQLQCKKALYRFCRGILGAHLVSFYGLHVEVLGFKVHALRFKAGVERVAGSAVREQSLGCWDVVLG